jgi:hypothetical protein
VIGEEPTFGITVILGKKKIWAPKKRVFFSLSAVSPWVLEEVLESVKACEQCLAAEKRSNERIERVSDNFSQ